jgi:hypothetical protein
MTTRENDGSIDFWVVGQFENPTLLAAKSLGQERLVR